jgi:hypothetical protein
MARADNVTQEENLVLGLYGGLVWKNPGGTARLCYDPQATFNHLGSVSMNPNQPKRSMAYLDDASMLSPLNPVGGHYSDGAAPVDPNTGKGGAADSSIPEILDKFPNAMPWLYLRAHPGKDGVIANNDPDSAVVRRHYDLSDVYAYTRPDDNGNYIGEGKRIRPKDYVGAVYGTVDPTKLSHGFREATPPSANARTIIKGDNSTPQKTYVYPYDAWPYFRDPSTPYIHTGNATDDAVNSPRAKDRFILISAGLDRVYGTADDICSFDDVLPQ